MDIRKLQRAIVDGLEDVKAQDIVVFNTEHLSPLFERVIIASGTSNRQTKALAAGVRDAVKAIDLPILSTEGADNGEWIIVDCGAAVAHIMQPTIREYYRLEEIWGGKPIKMKLASAGKGLAKAESSSDDDEDNVPTRAQKKSPVKTTAKTLVRTGAKAAATQSAPGRSGAAKPSAGKTAVTKTPARKTSAGKPQVAKKPVAKKPVAKSPVAKKAVAGKASGAGKAAPPTALRSLPRKSGR